MRVAPCLGNSLPAAIDSDAGRSRQTAVFRYRFRCGQRSANGTPNSGGNYYPPQSNHFGEVRPTFKKLFEVYDRLLFQFHDVKIQVDYARQASAALSLDVISERGRRRNRQEIQVKAKIDFQKENGVWQAYFLRLFEVNINL